jgi:hypothetical protein
MPYGTPGAYWLLISDRVELRRTAYDLDAGADVLRKTSYPDIESFVANDLMKPRPEADMVQLFEGSAIK